jgi:hypothetical protein
MRLSKHKWIIDSASGKEYIEVIREGCDPLALGRFFEARVNWCGGYPLVHDRFVTYGAFDDLLDVLNADRRMELVPPLLLLAESVPDQQFHAALFLLGDMIPEDAIRQRPDGLSDSLLRLRLRAEKLAFLPNLPWAWKSLASKQRYLKAKGDFLAPYTPDQLRINESGWHRYFDFPLINLSSQIFAGHSLPWGEIRSRIQKLGALPGERKLIYATKIEGSRYWVWRIPGKRGTAHLFKIIFVRLSYDGEIGMGAWDLYQQFSERDTPEAISRRLMEIEFYPRALEIID